MQVPNVVEDKMMNGFSVSVSWWPYNPGVACVTVGYDGGVAMKPTLSIRGGYAQQLLPWDKDVSFK